MFVSLVVFCFNHTFVALRTSGHHWHVHIVAPFYRVLIFVAFCQLSFLMFLRFIRMGIEHFRVKFTHSLIICKSIALYDLCPVWTWKYLIGGSKDKREIMHSGCSRVRYYAMSSLIMEKKQSAYHKSNHTPAWKENMMLEFKTAFYTNRKYICSHMYLCRQKQGLRYAKKKQQFYNRINLSHFFNACYMLFHG